MVANNLLYQTWETSGTIGTSTAKNSIEATKAKKGKNIHTYLYPQKAASSNQPNQPKIFKSEACPHPKTLTKHTNPHKNQE
jgi:hypothetical protein